MACSFGDASVNQAAATAALNAAGWATFSGLSVPVLFVCEDNGIGVSVKSPPGWVDARATGRPGSATSHADGGDLADTYDVTAAAAAFVRAERGAGRAAPATWCGSWATRAPMPRWRTAPAAEIAEPTPSEIRWCGQQR